MMEEELIKIWQSSPEFERVKFEKSRLMLDMNASMDRFHRSIRNRDLREYAAVAIIIPVFAISAFVLPSVVSKIASVLIIGYALFVAMRLRDARKHKPSEVTVSYREYVLNTRAYLLIQKRLLDTVVYWYILPGVTLTMLFTLGFGIADRTKSIVKMAVGNLALAVATYYLNKQAVKKELAPRIAKAEELIALLDKD